MNKDKLILHGIKNCDSVRKARDWLDQHNVAYDFYDFRSLGISQSTIKGWCDELGWDVVLNKRGTSYRQLSDKDKENLTASNAIKLMSENPTLIKRPVLTIGNTVNVGFDEKTYQKLSSKT